MTTLTNTKVNDLVDGDTITSYEFDFGTESCVIWVEKVYEDIFFVYVEDSRFSNIKKEFNNEDDAEDFAMDSLTKRRVEYLA